MVLTQEERKYLLELVNVRISILTAFIKEQTNQLCFEPVISCAKELEKAFLVQDKIEEEIGC